MVIRKAGYDTGKDHKVFRGDKLETCIVVLFALKFSTVLLGPAMQDLRCEPHSYNDDLSNCKFGMKDISGFELCPQITNNNIRQINF